MQRRRTSKIHLLPRYRFRLMRCSSPALVTSKAVDSCPSVFCALMPRLSGSSVDDKKKKKKIVAYLDRKCDHRSHEINVSWLIQFLWYDGNNVPRPILRFHRSANSAPSSSKWCTYRKPNPLAYNLWYSRFYRLEQFLLCVAEFDSRGSQRVRVTFF